MAAPLANTPDRNSPIIEEGRLPTEDFYIWMAMISQLLDTGFTGTIVTAALTGGGTQGSMTFEHGILVSQVAAT